MQIGMRVTRDDRSWLASSGDMRLSPTPIILIDSSKRIAIDDDFNNVTITNFADRSARQCFGAHMTDTSTGANARESRIGE